MHDIKTCFTYELENKMHRRNSQFVCVCVCFSFLNPTSGTCQDQLGNPLLLEPVKMIN